MIRRPSGRPLFSDDRFGNLLRIAVAVLVIAGVPIAAFVKWLLSGG
ncbi:MAG: hypothetical protein J0I45_01015 [Bosea sp.]|nr:hypothetical protein [Bosea sp. (in: a-proteobacteria)]